MTNTVQQLNSPVSTLTLSKMLGTSLVVLVDSQALEGSKTSLLTLAEEVRADTLMFSNSCLVLLGGEAGLLDVASRKICRVTTWRLVSESHSWTPARALRAP